MIKIFRFRKKSYSRKELELFHFLGRNPLFKKLDYKELFLFASNMHLRTYNENEVIFFRNDPSNALYLLQSGHVDLKIDIDNSNKDFERLHRVPEGSAFGENALLEESHRVYHAFASSPNTSLYVIPAVNIHEIFSSNPAIKAKMLEAFGEIYDNFAQSLFRAYRSSYGFFSLDEIYNRQR
ncbi:MAG: cyclic nucleotide-binding domain-containing protein [Cytophagales bacterium]|nr:cyclic nucleotide-binding domain-containing protein [Cytophagales bacterium]